MAPNNPLPCYGNEKTMNMNHLILTNIQSSPYFKVNLYELKTYHEVIDEIYYKVSHLEPWEKGSRKTAGQTGMCGGVRGVGAGGIVSSAFCLLYKLFTLKLTRKQLMGLLTHTDSPYIRGLGFMYIRYTQPPGELWDWYGEYLEDEEELDVRAGGGHIMTIGEMLRLWMTKLEWYSTLFPRIPVPIQKQIEGHLREYDAERCQTQYGEANVQNNLPPGGPTSMTGDGFGPPSRSGSVRDSPPSKRSPAPNSDRGVRTGRPSPPFDIAKEMNKKHSRSHSKDRDRHSKRSRSRDRHSKRSGSKERRHRSRSGSRERKRHHRSRSRDRKKKERKHRSRSREKKHRSRSRSRDRHHKKHRSRSRERSHHKDKHRSSRESSFERDLQRERDRIKKDKYD